MSFPYRASHPFLSPTFACGDGDGIWPSHFMDNSQQDLPSQFERHPSYKRAGNSENKPSKFSLLPPMNQTNVLGNNGSSHIFFKTRICARFTYGLCRNGDHCTFAHGAEDLRDPPPNWQNLIREKDRGTEGNWSDDQRIPSRTKVCKKYYSGEDCPYGEKCIFIHERAPPKFKNDVYWHQENSAISVGTKRHAVWNPNEFAQPDSDKQLSGNVETYQVRPEFWKTKLCSKWEIGQCPFGERCHYVHGRAEMAVNLNSGIPAKSSLPPTNPLISCPLTEGRENKKTFKWKPSKKMNRIYADWIDDLSPPYNNEEDT